MYAIRSYYVIVRNTNQQSADYGDIAKKFRPGHADYPFYRKYGIRDYRGGGRSSGRITSYNVCYTKLLRFDFEGEGSHR